MELDLDLPKSTPVDSIVTTSHDDRVAVFLREADHSPPQRIPILAELPVPDFESSLPGNIYAARFLLIKQRTSKPGYRKPELQIRHKFRTKKRKDLKCNGARWTFTNHEVAKAFDGLLSAVPLAPPGVAQALLSHASITSLDELWCHFHDPALKKRMKGRFEDSESSMIPENPWLNMVIGREDLEYIRLICQVGLRQEILDRVFSISLSMHLMGAMQVLLSFGAVASACQHTIRERVRLDDLALVRLLLSAPKAAMSVEAWRYCVEPEVESLKVGERKPHTILLLCLAHRPEVVSGLLLLKALKSQDLQATAIILAYARSDEDFHDVRQEACKWASHIQKDEHRHKLFKLLARSGFLTDGPVLRKELLKDVKTRQLPLVQLLAKAGVSLDIEPHNAVRWAVLHMDFDILELFKNGNFSSPISLALNFVPDSASEPDVLRLMEIFPPKGLAGTPLDLHLVRAVQKHHVRLVESLLRYGASVEFEQASAIQTAIRKADFDILNVLLERKCSPNILSTTIPMAMALQPRLVRLQAIKALTKKGVPNQDLAVPLQQLVSEDSDVDSELIKLLLQHKAPVDEVGDDAKNAVLIAARRSNVPVLKMLCDAEPRKETLSKTVPIVFGAIHIWDYNVVLDMIKLLLQKGAAGVPIHQTLLAATEQDYQLGIVRLLVEHGADANHSTGASFSVALKTENFKLLEILCAGCPPDQTSMEAVLFLAIAPRYYNLQALELLLGSIPSAAAVLDALWASAKLRGNSNITEIIPCFLRHGLNVDLGNGDLLCFAIHEKDITLLKRILSVNPSINTLATAFQTAAGALNRSDELETMELLLEKAGSAEIGQSELLLQETHVALAGDLLGLELLLRHKAVVDFDNGRAVQAAATAGAFKILDLLLLSKPAPSTINKACLAADESSVITWSQKESIFEQLLAANGGVLTADVSFQTLKLAVGTSSRNLFVALASGTKTNTIAKIFRYVRKTTVISGRKYWIYQCLLCRGIPSDNISEALLDSFKANDLGDLSFPKLLLEYGATVSYKNGAAFSLALRAKSLEAVKILSQYIIDDNMASVAFDLARQTTSLDPCMRVEVYRCLLQWNIRRSSLYHVLVDTLKGDNFDIALVQLLLAKGADPNEDEARCFILALQASKMAEFQALSKYAKLGIVLKALINHFQEEWEVVRLFKFCLEQQPSSAKILDQNELLFQCMKNFPQGTILLKLLLDNGVSASAKVTQCLCTGWQPEPCTALIWAIFSKPRIHNDVILVLLAQGGDAVLPAYSTPVTKVSAAFGCLLDKTRTPILKALLDMDRDRILDYVIPGSSFGYLGAYPNISSLLDAADELPLRGASLYLGNFDAFRLMNCGEAPNDGTLHSAALMALPKFVTWLLDIHDPNYKGEEFENMIPLAIVCSSKPHPWCKIANEESDWRSRQKETMELLAPKTSPKWRYRNKTVLHIALENGVETTKAMIEALDVRHDKERDEKYLYVDKDGIEYSPVQYVKKLLDVEEEEKAALTVCLTASGMRSRYFKRIAPNEGDQPEGYHGLPPDYDALWRPYTRDPQPPGAFDEVESLLSDIHPEQAMSDLFEDPGCRPS